MLIVICVYMYDCDMFVPIYMPLSVVCGSVLPAATPCCWKGCKDSARDTK